MHDFNSLLNIVFIFSLFCYVVSGIFFFVSVYCAIKNMGIETVLSGFGVVFLTLGVLGTVLLRSSTL